MEYNERGKPLKRLSSLTNPKSAGLHFVLSDKTALFGALLQFVQLPIFARLIKQTIVGRYHKIIKTFKQSAFTINTRT